ncbi:hypothetical protein [Microbacterium sp. NPDC055683]
MTPTFSTLWAVNGALDVVELRRQLDDFAAAGLDGVVFHPRRYPDDPRYLGDDYLAIVSQVVRDARDRGLAFWIYDENGWPSGTVGGEMLRRHPALRQRWLDLVPDDVQDALVRFRRAGRAWAVVERHGEGVDYLSPDLGDRFIDLCYDRYMQGLDPDASAHVAGFFSDEPELGLGHAQHLLSRHGAVPWTPDLPAQYRARHDRDLLDDLPSVFLTDERSAAVRTRFWELVGDLFAERYLARLDDWCRERGLTFTAHLKGEEHPLFQLPTSGSLGSAVRGIGLPGLDALGRLPVNDFYPRLVATTARQFGDGRVMAEAFGGAGWGASPADLERYLLWLGRHGVTDFVLHLSQYRLDSEAIEDWPPSHPRHVSWAGAYAEVLASVRADLARAAAPGDAVLVVVPQRALAERFEPWEFTATNVHDAHDYPATEAGAINDRFLAIAGALHEAGVAADFADERTVEAAVRLEAEGIRIGRARYRSAIVPADAVLDEGTRAILAPFAADVPSAGPPADRAPASASLGDGPPARIPLATGWAPEGPLRNELPLEPRRIGGRWVCELASVDFAGSVELRFADTPEDPRWNGDAVAITSTSDLGATASVDVRPGCTGHVDLGEARRAHPVPRVWAAGPFRVRVAAIRDEGPLTALAGPFALASGRATLGTDLTAEGLPFAFEPIDVATVVTVPPGTRALVLDGCRADAVFARIGDAPGRWLWGEGPWTLPVDHAGDVHVRLRVVPSSFNRYGPHHHYASDPTTVSPAQMRGDRNYADRDDAPLHTHVAGWWVRTLALPSLFAVPRGAAVDTRALTPLSLTCESIHAHEGVTYRD